MKVAAYTPNDFHKIFLKRQKDIEVVYDKCDSSVDVIYCASGSVLTKALEAKKRFNKPLVCWVWDITQNWRDWCRTPQDIQNHSHRDGIANRITNELKQCDLVISASKWTQKVLKTHYGIDSEQMYFYIDKDDIESIPAQVTKPQITQISRFALNKRFEDSIYACKDIKNMLCIGTGSTVPLVNAQRQYGNNNVEYLVGPNRKRVITEIKKSELLLSPSVFEGFGMTPIEAIWCDTPILVSDLEVFTEIYDDGIVYHKMNDMNDQKEKIKMILGDKELQKKIITNGKKSTSELTVDKFIVRWKKMMERV
jgi:glycosyltransferase involved in cell wall biosynthesis